MLGVSVQDVLSSIRKPEEGGGGSSSEGGGAQQTCHGVCPARGGQWTAWEVSQLGVAAAWGGQWAD